MMLEHKLQRNFLPQHAALIDHDVASLKKVALANGSHIPLTNGIYAHVDDAARAL